MATFSERLGELETDAHSTIQHLIETKGVDSKDYSVKVLKIEEFDLMYNLDGGRWLAEISAENLIDNCGNQYNYSCIELSKLCEIIDYFND